MPTHTQLDPKEAQTSNRCKKEQLNDGLENKTFLFKQVKFECDLNKGIKPVDLFFANKISALKCFPVNTS